MLPDRKEVFAGNAPTMGVAEDVLMATTRFSSHLFLASVVLCMVSMPMQATSDVKSQGCRPKCGRYEYEYVPCYDTTDRQCKDMVTLPKPSLSQNLIYEDRRDVKQVVSHVIAQDITINLVANTIHLKRGSGFSVQVTLKELNLAPLFRPVDHSVSNDNDAFQGDARILKDYCSHPMPDKYQFSLVLHQGVTTRARPSMPCGSEDGRSSAGGGVGGGGGGGGGWGMRCPEEPGFYLSPRESCQTYDVFGRLPALHPNNWSVVCLKPGRLTDLFGVSDELRDTATMSIDKSLKCADQRASCNSCSIRCARHMQGYQGSHRCNITSDDADNGQSPRLQFCFTCCSVHNCSKDCQVYQGRECQPIRCMTGNVAEFVLVPIFPPPDSSIFACHLEQVKGYKVYDIEYSVIYRGDVLNDVKIYATQLHRSGLPHKKADSHNFLLIHYGSEVTASPDQLEGNAATGRFSVGYYQATGTSLSKTEISSKVLYLRPRRPFAVGSSIWKKEGCDTELLSEFNVLPDSLSHLDAFRQDPHIEVEFVSPFTYRLLNMTQSRPPFIYFEIQRDQSILRPFYPPTTVKDDDSLRAELSRRDQEWSLHIEGHLLACPGSFELIVRDPAYPTQPLFHFDFGVSCPEKFTVDCTIPTEGPATHDKTLRVDLIDSYRTIKMTVFRPAQNATTTTTSYNGNSPPNPREEDAREATMSVFSPFVAMLCVLISILGFLLLFGVITESGGYKCHRTEVVLHSRRLLFVVCYVTFRATYSIVVTFTVLVLLISHANRDSMNVLREFSSFVRSVEANQTHQLDRIQAFVSDELLRQNRRANETKNACEQKLGQLQNTLDKIKQELMENSQDDRIVSQVALQYTKLMILNLTTNIIKFKQEFAVYANKSLDRLLRNMRQTSMAIENNKWLSGARLIYDTVRSKRSAQGRDTKPFADWAAIRNDVDKLSLDLSLRDFPMPNLTDFLDLDLPKTIERENSTHPGEVVLPRNQWYYQYERKPVSSVWSSRSRSEKDLKVKIKFTEIMSWATLMAIVVMIDIVWFVHRMARTYSTAKTLLYGGHTTYLECHQMAADGSLRRLASLSSPSSRCLQFVKDLNFRIMRTDFVPKAVASVTICCAVYVALVVFDRLLTMRTLSSVGYFDALMAPVETSYQLAVTRIRTNAYRIRKFEFPFYEELVNLRTKRYQLMAEMYAEIRRSSSLLRSSEFCAWKRLLAPEEPCYCPTVSVETLKFDGCELSPVLPQINHRHDFYNFRELLNQSIAPYVDASRHLVADSCHLVVIFLGVVVLTDLLDTVMWIYLQRFNILRLKPIIEDIDQYPTHTDARLT